MEAKYDKRFALLQTILPGHEKPGVVFVGVDDDGDCVNLAITDPLLLTLADMRSDGNILPIPSITVVKETIDGCEVAVIVVEPSPNPPVRYNGRTWIRVGPRRATASREEETPPYRTSSQCKLALGPT